jgi:hypothetical protein
LHGTTIYNAVVPFANIALPRMDGETGKLMAEGMFQDILSILSKQLNFTVVTVLPPDGKWGSINARTNTWNGMVRMLIDDEADVVTCGKGCLIRPNFKILEYCFCSWSLSFTKMEVFGCILLTKSGLRNPRIISDLDP